MKYALLFLLLATPTTHKFYVSLTEIRYNTEVHSLEISSKIFINDLESILPKLQIENNDEASVNTILNDYLLDNLIVSVNNKKAEMEFIGYEIEDDVVWCYLEAKGIEYPRSATIQYTILLDEFDQQVNIVHFDLKKDIKSLYLNSGQRSGEIVY